VAELQPRATSRTAERLGAVALDLPLGHDVRLAHEPSPQVARLDLVPECGGRHSESGGGLGEGEHGSVFGSQQILRGVEGDSSFHKRGVRSTKSSGRLDRVPEGSPRDHGPDPGLGHAHVFLRSLELLGRADQGQEVRLVGRHGSVSFSLGGRGGHVHNIADSGHVVKRNHPRSMGMRLG